MILANLKFGISSGLTFTWLNLGEYLYNNNSFDDIVIFFAIGCLMLLSLYMAYRSYRQLESIKRAETHEKYLKAAQSGDISKLRRLIISNPVEAASHIVIVTK